MLFESTNHFWYPLMTKIFWEIFCSDEFSFEKRTVLNRTKNAYSFLFEKLIHSQEVWFVEIYLKFSKIKWKKKNSCLNTLSSRTFLNVQIFNQTGEWLKQEDWIIENS